MITIQHSPSAEQPPFSHLRATRTGRSASAIGRRSGLLRGRVGPRLMTFLVCGLAAVPAVHGATFTVNSANDVQDGLCDAAHCSLRDAIHAANGTAGADQIEFAIPGAGVHTIAVGSALPAILETVTIDGLTQPGASANTLPVGSDAVLLIEIDGSGAPGGSRGLRLRASSCTVRGLVIHGFQAAAIESPDPLSGHTIEGNSLGLRADGTTVAGNGGGVRCVACSTSTIGGTSPAARNVISGNGGRGVQLLSSSSGNLIQGNYIGTDAGGTQDRGNGGWGVFVTGGSTNNTIGGSAPGAGNVISGNGEEGVRIGSAGASGNVVAGNLIGTDATGSAALGNDLEGVHVTAAPSTTIGGTAAGAGNVISGNGPRGILISDGATGTEVQGNLIGLDSAGTAALPNGSGILIQNSDANTIGGATAGARNVISGNTNTGVRIAAGAEPATGNVVAGNFIGTDASGTAALGNGGEGVHLHGEGGAAVSSNTIGGAAAGAGNVIAGNVGSGVLASGDNSTGNAILGNRIGTDLASSLPLPNASGVRFEDGASAQVQANHILSNGTGALLIGTSSFEATSDGNCVVFNGAGVDNLTGASTTFTDNWWGSPDGPSGAGPGAGDSVSADVVFSPFLAAAPAGCPTSAGMVTVVQDTVPDGPQDFDFSGDLGAFTLDDDADATLPNTVPFFAAPGAYAVTQSPVAGFDLVAIDCVDPSGDSVVDLAGGTAFIELGDGESVTCTFVSQSPTLSIPTLGVPGMIGLVLMLMAIGLFVLRRGGRIRS